MSWLIFWIAIYLLLIIYLTLRHVRTGDLEQYLVNNRNTPTFPLIATTLATFVGGGTSMGLMAMGYESGFAAVGIGIAYVIGFFILSQFAAKINRTGRKEKIYSFPQYLNSRYTSEDQPRFARLFSSVVSGVNIFIFFFLLAAQFVAMASLLKFTFNIGFLTAAIISCIIVILYTALAGLSGVILTDLLQFILLLILIVLVFIPGIWGDTEAFSRLGELPTEFLNGSYYGWAFIIALPLFLSPSVLIRMDIWQRILAARSERVARRVSIWSGLGMLPFYILFPLVGMTLKIILNDPVEPRDVTYLFIARHSNDFLLGFAVVGLMSALMSSGDSFLNLISISAIRDFSGWRKKKSLANKKHIHGEIRVAAIVFGFIALGMALVMPKIVDLMVVGLATIVIFVPVTLLALLKQNVYAYHRTAIFSILAGFITNLIFFIWGILSPEQFESKSSFIPAFLISSLILIAGYRMQRTRQ
jgi:SSS family solute:Na+ symporter